MEYTPTDFELSLQAVNQARSEARTCSNQGTSTTYNAASNLRWNGLLGEVARQRAEYIQQTGQLSHTEGSSTYAVAVRSQLNGYSYQEIRENLAQGLGSAEEAVSAWLSSTTGHCDSIMAPNLTEMGMVKQGDYWVLVIAQPK